MGQKQEKPLTAVLPPNEKFYGYFTNINNEKQNDEFTGLGKFIHIDFSVTGEFIKNTIVSIRSIELPERFHKHKSVFQLDFSTVGHRLILKINRLMKIEKIDYSDMQVLLNGEGTLTIGDAQCVKGHFIESEIKSGEIKTPEYEFVGTIDKNYVPLHGTIKFADYEWTGDCSTGHQNGKLIYKNGDVYEGECQIYSSYIDKHGKGCLTTQNYRVTGEWTHDKIDTREKSREEFKNGLIREGTWLKSKLRLKINISDFVLDMQQLSELFKNPPQIQDEKQTYELVFEGEVNDNFPKEGMMFIRKVFKFTEGIWDETGVLQCEKANLADLINKKEYFVKYIDGIEMRNSLASANSNGTATVPETHDEEGSTQN